MILTNTQKRVRTIWLWLLCALSTESLFTFLDLLDMPSGDHVRTPSAIMASFFIVTLGFLANLLTYYLLYRCAYNKPGTKYLTLCLIVGPFILLKQLIVDLKESFADINYLLLSIASIYYVLTLCWYIYGWRLRALNKALQRAEKETSLLSASSSCATISSSEA